MRSCGVNFSKSEIFRFFALKPYVQAGCFEYHKASKSNIFFYFYMGLDKFIGRIEVDRTNKKHIAKLTSSWLVQYQLN